MSLLISESYVNDKTPLWESKGAGGSGGGPILIGGSTSSNTFTFPGDGTFQILINELNMNTVGNQFFPDGFVDGTFIISASWCMNGTSHNNTFQGFVTEATSGFTVDCRMDSSDLPLSYVNGSVNFMFVYRPSQGADVPVFQMYINNFQSDQGATGTATWSIVFYPTTQAITYPV